VTAVAVTITNLGEMITEGSWHLHLTPPALLSVDICKAALMKYIAKNPLKLAPSVNETWNRETRI